MKEGNWLFLGTFTPFTQRKNYPFRGWLQCIQKSAPTQSLDNYSFKNFPNVIEMNFM